MNKIVIHNCIYCSERCTLMQLPVFTLTVSVFFLSRVATIPLGQRKTFFTLQLFCRISFLFPPFLFATKKSIQRVVTGKMIVKARLESVENQLTGSKVKKSGLWNEPFFLGKSPFGKIPNRANTWMKFIIKLSTYRLWILLFCSGKLKCEGFQIRIPEPILNYVQFFLQNRLINNEVKCVFI